MGIRILPPDVNRSGVRFNVTAEGIRFGLGAIRGVGSKTAEAIIEVRESGGRYESLADFCLRLPSQWLNRRVLDALIKCGAFDSTGRTRAALATQADDALRLAQRAQADAARNQMGLFGGRPKLGAPPQREAVAEWDANERLRHEREALGFYVSAHPLDRFEQEIARMGAVPTSELLSMNDGAQVQVAGVIHQVKLKNNRTGKRYATFSLEDREGTVEAIAWPETYQRFEALIHQAEPVAVRGKLDVDEERAQVIVDDVRLLGAALADAVREVRIRACKAALDAEAIDRLRQVLERHAGRTLVYLHLGLDGEREAVLLLGDNYRVAPTESFRAEVEQVLAPGAVELG
jgi:DNA polymerase-3 subunit alpha